MNTLEKRKLEAIIVSKLQDARTSYKERRQREHNALVEKFEKNAPPHVQKLAKTCATAITEYKRKCEELDKRKAELDAQKEAANKHRREAIEKAQKEAEALGFTVSMSTYDTEPSVSLKYQTTWTGRYGNTAVRTYSEPRLTAHDKETTEQIQKLDDMASEYAIAVWADNGDMGNLLDKFTSELKAIAA